MSSELVRLVLRGFDRASALCGLWVSGVRGSFVLLIFCWLLCLRVQLLHSWRYAHMRPWALWLRHWAGHIGVQRAVRPGALLPAWQFEQPTICVWERVRVLSRGRLPPAARFFGLVL